MRGGEFRGRYQISRRSPGETKQMDGRVAAPGCDGLLVDADFGAAEAAAGRGEGARLELADNEPGWRIVPLFQDL